MIFSGQPRNGEKERNIYEKNNRGKEREREREREREIGRLLGLAGRNSNGKAVKCGSGGEKNKKSLLNLLRHEDVKTTVEH